MHEEQTMRSFPDITQTANTIQQLIEMFILLLAVVSFTIAFVLFARETKRVFQQSHIEEQARQYIGTYRMSLVEASLFAALGIEGVLTVGALHFRTGSWLIGLLWMQIFISCLISSAIWWETRRWIATRVKAGLPCPLPSGWLVGGLGVAFGALFAIGWLLLRGMFSFVSSSISIFEWLWVGGVIIPLATTLGYAVAVWLSCQLKI
jgi:tryptophan-rich sensory protein